ncbi:hypothetical protein ACNOYE_20625 [Nannocystaceae bacterium ST9]
MSIALAGTLSACASDEAGPSPELIGMVVYEYYALGVSYEIRSDGGQAMQLLAVDGGLEVIAELTDETAATLATEFDALEAGQTDIGQFDAYCLSFLDRGQVALTVPSNAGRLSFSYPWQCAPSGLETIDAIFRDLILVLPDCAPSASVQSCEIR